MTTSKTTFLFSSKGYSFFAMYMPEDRFYEICLDKAGDDFTGMTADTLAEARQFAREYLADVTA